MLKNIIKYLLFFLVLLVSIPTNITNVSAANVVDEHINLFKPFFINNKMKHDYIITNMKDVTLENENFKKVFTIWQEKVKPPKVTKPKDKENKVDKEYIPIEGKVAYLTFDDGPYPQVTEKVLDILKEEDIKGTFFILGNQLNRKASQELLKRIYEEGHGIGNHTYTHDYNVIFQSPEAFWEDFKKAEDKINEVIGIKPKIYRVPSGSYPRFKIESRNYMNNKGYIYYDWNIDSGDSRGINLPKETILNNTISMIDKLDNDNAKLFILMHDSYGHNTTAEALPEIIHYLKEKGYNFEVITEDTKPHQFRAKE